MVKAYQAAAKEISGGHIAAAYIIVGTEEWSRNKLLALLKKTVLDPAMADFNLDQVNAAEVNGVKLVDKAGMLPMMADRRLIIAENCDKWQQADIHAVPNYLGAPNDKTCLVLLFSAADRRKKLFKFKSPLIRYLEFEKPRPWELPEYIAALARELKLALTDEAIALVAEYAGDDLGVAHRELDKLSLYKLGSSQVGPEDVAAVMGHTRQVTRWELDDFIGNRNLHGALVKLHDILDSGEERSALLSTVNLFLKRLFSVKAMMVKGFRDPYQVGQVLGVPGRIAEKLIRQQQAYSDPELRSAFVLLQETDYRLKSAAMNRSLLLDHLLCRIIERGPLSPPTAKVRAAGRK